MKKQHYTKTQPYAVYALVHPEERWFFIGKTTSSRLSAVFSRHVCGKNMCTKHYFTDEEDYPDFFVLELKLLTAAEGYKHVLAWINIFQAEGFYCLNHEKTEAQAETPLEETKRIIDECKKDPLKEILNRTKVNTPGDADRLFLKHFPEDHQKDVLKQEERTVQMNVRMQEQDRKRFDSFCKELKITQKEGFCLLLDQMLENGNVSNLEKILMDYQKQIRALEKERDKLQKEKSALKGKSLSKEKNDRKKKRMILKNGIENYLACLFPEETNTTLRKLGNYKNFTKSLPTKVKYSYPDKEGSAEITLDAVVWGNTLTHACFIMGTSNTGERIKLRYYPKSDYIGISMKDSTYAEVGSKWYVLFMNAPDDAVDLIAAFPLRNVCSENAPLEIKRDQKKTEEKSYASLDQKIQSAEARKQQVPR